MIVSDLAVQKRTTVFVLTIVIVIAGLVAYESLPLEAAPDVQTPFVFVQTMYRGVSPEDIEQSITIEIEKKLKGLEGVKKITSLSSEGMSMINIEFMTDIDIDDALIKVKDKVDLAKPELPADLEDDPAVFEVNFSEMPILVLSLSGNLGLRSLTRIAEDLQDDIEGIAGVLEVEVAGDVTREIQIQVDPQRMALYGIPFTQLQAIVSGENANVSGGAIRTVDGRYQLRVPGEFETAEEVEEIVVDMRSGQPVYLRDLAIVVDGIEDRESYSRTNGKNSVNLYVKKRTGENIVEIVDAVDGVVAESKKAWPPGIEIVRVSDRAKDIRDMVADLENNILTGLLLVIVIVMTVMGFRNAVLVSVSIPMSMLMTFIVLKALGITLNMVVLFSLTLALGMLVDNAIVIVENIYRFMQQGVPRMEAAMRATSEVAYPIIGSGLTTIFAFTPLLFWDGIMGGFMVFLPRTVIITLVSCLFVALVINPALAAVLMKVKSNGKNASADEVMSGGEHPMLDGGGGVLGAYRWILRMALRYRLGVVAFSGVVLLFMILLWMMQVGLRTPVEFFPSTDPGTAWISIKPPKGADLDHIDQIVREVACRVYDERAGSEAEKTGEIERLSYSDCIHPVERTKYSSGETFSSYSHIPTIEFVYEKATLDQGSDVFGGSPPNQVGLQFVELADRVDESGESLPSTKVLTEIEKLVKDVPGAEITVISDAEGPPTGAPINIEISGADFETLGRLAEQVVSIVERVPHTRNIRSDFEQGSPTLEIRVDRKRAALLGLTTQTIGFAIKAAINGIEVSTYREEDDDYDITVRFLEKDRRNIDTLRQIFLPSPVAGLVPLTTVADIEYTGGVGQITRIDHERVVTVKADVDETKTTGDTARQEAERLLAGAFRLSSSDILDWPALADLLRGQSTENDAVAAALRGMATDDLRAAGNVIAESGASVNGNTDNSTAAIRYGIIVLEACILFALAIGWLLYKGRHRQGLLLALAGIAAFVVLVGPTLAGGNVQQSKTAILKGLNETLADPELFDLSALDASVLPERAKQLAGTDLSVLPEKDVVRVNRLILENSLPEIVRKSPPTVDFPPGYQYEFTGENEFQKESEEFLGWAMLVALLLIFFTLVAQFNSITKPFIIMSAVVLALGGVFFGLTVHGMPFGIIMTGVGVISLAGVVVNNAIVLLDYIQQLIDRGLPQDEAIIAAGATRLRPVLLTAITTVLGLIPMLTGVSVDFQPMKQGHAPVIQWVSESSQMWAAMAAAVIWGLAFATLLTLVVVPVLFSLINSITASARWAVCAVVYEWWNHFDKKYNTDYARTWALSYTKALHDASHEQNGETPGS